MKNGEFFYQPQHMLSIIKAASERGIDWVYRVLGNGVESIAFLVPGGYGKTEVFKVSQHPVQDFILDIFKEKPFDPKTTIVDNELRKYLVPMRQYRIHDFDKNMKWYSYFQERLYTKKKVNGKESNIISDVACKNFSRQLKKETAFFVYEGENFPDQYGLYRHPNGEMRIEILDYGIVKSKLDDEADEYYDIKDALYDAVIAKAKRIKAGLPDMRNPQYNP